MTLDVRPAGRLVGVGRGPRRLRCPGSVPKRQRRYLHEGQIDDPGECPGEVPTTGRRECRSSAGSQSMNLRRRGWTKRVPTSKGTCSRLGPEGHGPMIGSWTGDRLRPVSEYSPDFTDTEVRRLSKCSLFPSSSGSRSLFSWSRGTDRPVSTVDQIRSVVPLSVVEGGCRPLTRDSLRDCTGHGRPTTPCSAWIGGTRPRFGWESGRGGCRDRKGRVWG